MALTKSRGNMYPFVTHTWNAIKGICFHDCPYCYMKKFDGLLPIRFDPKELEVNLGNGNFIFVGSGTDAWAFDVPSDWIARVLDYCDKVGSINSIFYFLHKAAEPFNCLEQDNLA